MATVTIFGGTGFIGRHVVRRLATAGHRVRVVARFPAVVNALTPAGDVVAYAGGITDPAQVRAAVSGADWVVNLVGILAEKRAGQFDTLHHQAARDIAQACAEAGVQRLVQISAIGADPASDSLYAASKGAGEAAVRAAFPMATVLRPSIVFGAEDNFFNMFARMARFSPFLPLIGGGKTRFQPVYVGDVAEAVLAALTRPEAAGQIYELGGPQVWSFADLLRFVLAATGRQRCLLPIPFGVARVQAAILERLPGALLTRDQVKMLEHDNVVTGQCPGLDALGVAAPQSVRAVVPGYLAIHSG